MRSIVVITTGGTIEKIYDESSGELVNRGSILRAMLEQLRLEETIVRILPLFAKDSLDMDDADRARVVEAVREAIVGGDAGDGVVILHGTDTLEKTGEAILKGVEELGCAVVLTGAMRPYEMKKSDALQNLTEAVFAASVLEAGVYCVAHGRALKFPGVRKDRERMTFVKG